MNRNYTIDAIKAFAIICVVLGHCIQYGSGEDFLTSEAFYQNPVFKIIYSFHMPLFALISGYLFGFSSNKYDWKTLIRKKAQSLLIPIFVWALLPTILFLASSLQQDASGLSIGYCIKSYLSFSLTFLWFLWAIFWCSIITIIVKKFFRDSIPVYCLGILVSFLLPDHHCFGFYYYLFPFFLIGYFYCTKPLPRLDLIQKRPWLFFLFAAVYCALMLVFSTKTFIYVSGYKILFGKSIAWEHLVFNIHRFFVGLTGSIIVITLISVLSKKISINPHLKRFITYTGQNTMGIYIISTHLCALALPPLTRHFSFSIWVVLAECILILLLSLFFNQLIKSSALRLPLLGIHR